MAREGDYFVESAPFKKARISQEVDAESTVSLPLENWKTRRSRSAQTSHQEGQVKGKSVNHDWNIS
jgi:hypothetical protein